MAAPELRSRQTKSPTPSDPRKPGEALWPERHGIRLLEQKRRLDPLLFETMYQGHPAVREGLLYGDNFKTYDRLPEDTVRRANYTDTADTGEDYLCSVCYEVGRDGIVYITDAVYSPLGMEETEILVADMLLRNGTVAARIESNNGGRGFAREVAKRCREVRVEWFHQSHNKEARILSNAPGRTEPHCDAGRMADPLARPVRRPGHLPAAVPRKPARRRAGRADRHHRDGKRNRFAKNIRAVGFSGNDRRVGTTAGSYATQNRRGRRIACSVRDGSLNKKPSGRCKNARRVSFRHRSSGYFFLNKQQHLQLKPVRYIDQIYDRL